jgi:hypothetical protein
MDFSYNEQAEMMKKRLKEAYQNGEIDQKLYAGVDSDFINSFSRSFNPK